RAQRLPSGGGRGRAMPCRWAEPGRRRPSILACALSSSYPNDVNGTWSAFRAPSPSARASAPTFRSPEARVRDGGRRRRPFCAPDPRRRTSARSGVALRVTRTLALVTMALCVLVAPSARAADPRFHPELSRAIAELERARGAEAYTALRRIWNAWDRANPLHVEEALLAAERSPRLAPPARAYAGTLAALARVRRGDLAAARSRLRELGYLDRWLVLGPFSNEGKSGLFATHGPEAELSTPITPAKPYTGAERPVRWRAVPEAFPYGFLDLASLVRPEAKVCAFVASTVRDAERAAKPRPATVWIGSGGAFRMFWNGREVASHDAYTAHDFDRIAVTVPLEPGPNLFVLKVCGEDRAPVVSVRLGDARGAPIPGLVVSNELADVAAATERAATPATALPQAVEGPL